MKTSKTVELTPEAQDAIENLIEAAQHYGKSLTRYHKLELDQAIGHLRECVGTYKRVY